MCSLCVHDVCTLCRHLLKNYVKPLMRWDDTFHFTVNIAWQQMFHLVSQVTLLYVNLKKNNRLEYDVCIHHSVGVWSGVTWCVARTAWESSRRQTPRQWRRRWAAWWWTSSGERRWPCLGWPRQTPSPRADLGWGGGVVSNSHHIHLYI